MRLPVPALLAVLLAALVTACGEVAPESPSSGASGDVDAGADALVNYGLLVAEVRSGTGVDGGLPVETFDVETLPSSTTATAMTNADASSCPGASVGACCFVAQSTSVDATSAAPLPKPPPLVLANVGTVTLADGTTGQTLATLGYGPFDGSLGEIVGYRPDSLSGVMWAPGDDLTVTNGGSMLGAFRISARALAVPDLVMPDTVVPGKAITLSWMPDANATSIWFDLTDPSAGSVYCQVQDAVGRLTVDGSLLSSFAPGDQVFVIVERGVNDSASLVGGTLEFLMLADLERVVSVE